MQAGPGRAQVPGVRQGPPLLERLGAVGRVRGHRGGDVQMTSATFSRFLTPPPPVRIHRIQGDPYGCGIVFVDSFFEVAF